MACKLKTGLLTGLIMLVTGVVQPRAETVTLQDVFAEFDESALTNLDLSVLPSLTGLNEQQLRTLCRELQTGFRGNMCWTWRHCAKWPTRCCRCWTSRRN